jgi:hypothetical protein
MIKVGKTEKPKISDELAEVGFYARFTESASYLPSFAPPSSRTQQSPPFTSSSTSPSPPAPRSPPPRSLASYPTRSLTCAASFPAARAYAPATSTRSCVPGARAATSRCSTGSGTTRGCSSTRGFSLGARGGY